MSMSHPDHEPPSSTIHGELRGKIISPPMPPMPPLPPPGAAIDLLRETVEVQARTIRYLLQNYEALLRKVGHDADKPPPFEIEWSVGTMQNFAAAAAIPEGWWIAPYEMSFNVAGMLVGTDTPQTQIPGAVPFWSDGTVSSVNAMPLWPLTMKIVHKE